MLDSILSNNAFASNIRRDFSISSMLTSDFDDIFYHTVKNLSRTFFIWFREQDLNLQPTDYKSVALPIVLSRNKTGGRGRIRTLKPFSGSNSFQDCAARQYGSPTRIINHIFKSKLDVIFYHTDKNLSRRYSSHIQLVDTTSS